MSDSTNSNDHSKLLDRAKLYLVENDIVHATVINVDIPITHNIKLCPISDTELLLSKTQYSEENVNAQKKVFDILGHDVLTETDRDHEIIQYYSIALSYKETTDLVISFLYHDYDLIMPKLNELANNISTKLKSEALFTNINVDVKSKEFLRMDTIYAILETLNNPYERLTPIDKNDISLYLGYLGFKDNIVFYKDFRDSIFIHKGCLIAILLYVNSLDNWKKNSIDPSVENSVDKWTHAIDSMSIMQESLPVNEGAKLAYEAYLESDKNIEVWGDKLLDILNAAKPSFTGGRRQTRVRKARRRTTRRR